MLADSDGILDNRPAVVPFGPDGVLAVYSSDWRLRGANNVAGAGRLPLKTDLYATMLRGGGSDRPPRNWPTPGRSDGRSSRSIPTSRETSSGCGTSAWSAAARPISSPAASSIATPNTRPIATATARWRTCGAMPRTRPTWIGWATATTTTASATSIPGGSRRRPWTSTTTRPGSSPPTPTSGACEWPNGHRNVIFTRRGIRTLPRGDMQRRREVRHARHQDALRLPEAVRRHLRQPHQRHGHGHRLARQRSAGRAGRGDLSRRPQQLRVRRAPRGASPRANVAATGSDPRSVHTQGLHLERLGQGLPARLRKLQRPHQHALPATPSCWSRSPAARRSSRPSAPAAASPPPTTSGWSSSATAT